MKIDFLTYGCKVNQYDAEILKQLLLKPKIKMRQGNLYIINSCTVTEKVEKEIIRKIKQLKKNKNNKILLTGCFIKKNIEKIKDCIDWIVPGNSKFDIKSYPEELFDIIEKEIVLQEFSERNKAFIKIEEGCNKFCSYCIVPFVRGSKIKIRDEKEIIKEIEVLLQKGYKEFVLSGVNLGLYGSENLINLLKNIKKIINGARVRLSSIGPVELKEELVDYIADNINFICPHFHLSLQSGDDRILKLMNRDYTTSYYEKKCNYIIKKIPDAAITTDVIAGFPQEGEKEFLNTYDFIKKLPFTRLHVFSYSDREGTKSSLMPGKVDLQIKKERVKKLIELGNEKEKEFITKNMNKIKYVLVENKTKNGFFEGYSENYIRAILPDKNLKPGELIKVRITGLKDKKAICEIISSSEKTL